MPAHGLVTRGGSQPARAQRYGEKGLSPPVLAPVAVSPESAPIGRPIGSRSVGRLSGLSLAGAESENRPRLLTHGAAGPAGMAIGRITAWFWRYLRQRIELTPWQAIVLRCVKRSGGGTIAELVEHLDEYERQIVDRDDFAEALLSMLDIERMDGTRTQLVDQGNGRWWAVDV